MLTGLLLGLAMVVGPTGAMGQATPGVAEVRAEPGAIDGQAWRKNYSQDAMGQTLGYWNIQEAALERVAKEYPALADRARALRDKSRSALGPAVEEVLAECKKQVADWSLVEQEFTKQREQFLATPLSELEAKALLDTLEDGIKGEFESPVGQTLMSFQPAFQADPKAEISAGYLTAISTAFEPRALGLKFAMHRPMSWVVFDSGAETIPLALRSYGGEGDAMGMLYVRRMDEKQIQGFKERGFASFGQQEAVTEQGGRFLGQAPMKVAGREGAWTRYLVDREQGGTFVRIHTWAVQFVEKDLFVSFQWQIAQTAATRKGLPSDDAMQARHAFFEPLFRELTDHFEIDLEEP